MMLRRKAPTRCRPVPKCLIPIEQETSRTNEFAECYPKNFGEALATIDDGSQKVLSWCQFVIAEHEAVRHQFGLEETSHTMKDPLNAWGSMRRLNNWCENEMESYARQFEGLVER